MSNLGNLSNFPSRNKVFLGGACSSNWRDKITPELDRNNVRYFNPVVDNWTSDCIKIEDDEKNNRCNIHLYYFDSSMSGVYSIAELVKSCYDTILSRNVDLVIFVVNSDGFSEHQMKSMDAVYNLAIKITGKVFYKITDNDNYVSDLSSILLRFSNDKLL